MSISPEKLAANRSNAEQSTGPNTDDGKATSSQNATKHGLTGRTVVLPHEDKNEFQRFSVEVIACLAPEGTIECEFAQIVANAQWRLRRIKSIEDGLLAYGRFGPTDPYAEPECFQDSEVLARSFMENTRSFSNLSHYEHRLYRNMTNALKQVKDLQAARGKHEDDVTTAANHLFTVWTYDRPTLGRRDSPPEQPAASISGDAATSRVAPSRAQPPGRKRLIGQMLRGPPHCTF
jgi:hypothetical protein